jgi:hypothetical protein
MAPSSAPGLAQVFRTAGGSLIDPAVVRSGGSAPTWFWGDGNDDTGDSVNHTYGAPGDYSVTWDIVDAAVIALLVSNDEITELNTKSTWDMISFRCDANSLTTLDTFDTWVNFTLFHCHSNNLTSLDTFATWTSLTTLYCHDNSITSLDTFSDWTSLSSIFCHENSLTTLEVFSTWVVFDDLLCYDNSLPAPEIDDILINLDTAGVSNGTLAYENNPGSADGARSGAATTAKANLVSKGWVVTN